MRMEKNTFSVKLGIWREKQFHQYLFVRAVIIRPQSGLVNVLGVAHGTV
jgi:hypothetical protein